MAGSGRRSSIDRELSHLSEPLRRREWRRRVEAALFASAAPVPRAALARIVGREANVDRLIEELRAELVDRPYDVAAVGDGWILRTDAAYADAVRAAAALREPVPRLGDGEAMVLAAVAYRQPVSFPELRELMGAEIDRRILTRLRARDLIAPGPRSPRPGAPRTWVTTPAFLAAFDLESLADLPEEDVFDPPP